MKYNCTISVCSTHKLLSLEAEINYLRWLAKHLYFTQKWFYSMRIDSGVPQWETKHKLLSIIDFGVRIGYGMIVGYVILVSLVVG